MMSYTTQSSGGWLQYRPPLMASGGLPDATDQDEETAKLSLENSCTNYGDLNLRDGKTKPTRRRSRASKKTPIIFLDANKENFRALVQQYTGCHASSSSSSYKGPINLNFGAGTEYNDIDIADRSISMFGYKDFDLKTRADKEHQQLQLDNLQQVHDQDDQYPLFSRAGSAADASLVTAGNPASYTTILENTAEENMFLHDLPAPDSSYGFQNDDFDFSLL